MLLMALILLPVLVALLCAGASAKRTGLIAVWGGIAHVMLFIGVAVRYASEASAGGSYDGSAQVLTASWGWLPKLGIELSVGADAVSMLLIGLTCLLGPIVAACSLTAIRERPRTFYTWLMVLQGAMVGVFAARDVMLFYICFEFTLVPMYVLINLYGSTNRKAAATKFFLYTFTGSILALAGLVYVAWFGQNVFGGGWSFAFDDMMRAGAAMPVATQTWVFVALMAGFAVKVPLFPVHTWLPLAHTEAPTAGSVVLAGVLLKLGTYGIYTFALMMTPAAALAAAPTVAVLAIIGIVYAGLICWVQRDVKKLVAYSSVSHLGFCVLGLFSLNAIGVSGSVLYMVNHGLSTGALFLLIGMIYERYHTRSMDELGGLASKMPVWSTFMVFFAMASVGLPGLNGFVSEFMCLLGAFQGGMGWSGVGEDAVEAGVAGPLGPWFAAFAALGLVVTAIYILLMVGRVVWGPLREPAGHDDHHDDDEHALPTDLNAREISILLPLAALCLGLGLYPKPVLRMLEEPTQQVQAVFQAEIEARELDREAEAARMIEEQNRLDAPRSPLGGSW